MKFLVCGGRDYKDDLTLRAIMRAMVRPSLDHDEHPIVIITGGALGADALAHQWAKDCGFVTKVFPADWEKYGKRAGPIRNRQMIEENPDYVIAFPGGTGTADMVKVAKERGRGCVVIEVSGCIR